MKYKTIFFFFLVCNEFVARAYSGAGYTDFPGQMDLQVKWFEEHNWYTTNPNGGEIGDVMFFGDVSKQGERHELIISDVKEEKGVKKYKIAHAGHSGSQEYNNAQWRTASEVGDEFAGGLEFVGIGSVSQSNSSANNNTSPKQKPKTFWEAFKETWNF